MRPVDIIAKKRDGLRLTTAEIRSFIDGFTKGDIPDYQASAWAMAVFLRGMDEQETTDLTLAMAHSGQVLDLTSIAPLILDKHSSGGVGDKTTLVVAPLIAALGLYFGKMSGRGLGFSGGTLDKLESIPGFRSDLSVDKFLSQLKSTRIVVSGQTHDLAPADGKLYALRDVTGTVSSLPLIASSIMSKKIASGAQVILLDVKVGRGAFMKTEEEATTLANLMVKIGHGIGRRVGAVISDMNQPLGRAVGNALEVIEAIETLKNNGPADFLEHCITVATELLLLSGFVQDAQDGRSRLSAALKEGRALDKFAEWIKAQGGTPAVIHDYGVLPRAAIIEDIAAPRGGFVAAIDAEQVGLAVVALGGGREKKSDLIDYSVGAVLRHKIGDRVSEGESLLTLHASSRDKFQAAKQQLVSAFEFADVRPPPPPLIHQIIR